MRGATLPPTPPDAMQRKTVSREASVTSGKSPARSPHPKAWDASFVKTPAPTLDGGRVVPRARLLRATARSG